MDLVEMDDEEESQLKKNLAEVGFTFHMSEYSNFLVDMEPFKLARGGPPHEQSFPLVPLSVILQQYVSPNTLT